MYVTNVVKQDQPWYCETSENEERTQNTSVVHQDTFTDIPTAKTKRNSNSKCVNCCTGSVLLLTVLVAIHICYRYITRQDPMPCKEEGNGYYMVICNYKMSLLKIINTVT